MRGPGMNLLLGAAAAALLAACGGGDVAAEQQAMRSPERVQRKTAEALSVADAGSVSVSDIHLEKSDRGKSLVVKWKATGPAGDYLCNADKRIDFPVCEVAAPAT